MFRSLVHRVRDNERACVHARARVCVIALNEFIEPQRARMLGIWLGNLRQKFHTDFVMALVSVYAQRTLFGQEVPRISTGTIIVVDTRRRPVNVARAIASR